MRHPKVGLPPELADRLTRPFARFLKIEAAAGGALFCGTIAALIISNSTWSTPFLAFWETPIGVHFGSFDFTRSARHWVNDGLMTFFFFVVALELKRELVLGELKSFRIATLSLAGALGGMLAPVSLYLLLMRGQPGMHGWGTVMASDTAFIVGCLALLGSRVPANLRLFLLSLAIFDDVGAILVVAVGYGGAFDWVALSVVVLLLAATVAAGFGGVRSIPVYFFLGTLIWIAFDASGIHPTIAGVILGLMTPTTSWVSDERLRALFGRVLSYPEGEHWSGDTPDRRDLQRAGVAATEALSPVERLEIMLHPWVGFGVMPIFALANAGMAISGADIGQPVSVAVFAGLVLGKPVGVIVVAWVAVGVGAASRAIGLSWPLLAAGSLLTGVGFTMSLFIATLAYAPEMLNAAKLGILASSVVSAVTGLLMLYWLTSGSRDQKYSNSQ